VTTASPEEMPPSVASGATLVQRLAGRYDVLGLVGSGGMGRVYRVRDTELDEIVALKLLRREVIDLPGMLHRFRREVKLARRVTHPNVARAYDIGQHGGEHFLTMEYIDGEAVSEQLLRRRRFQVRPACVILREICLGLTAAHDAGIVHRDLKPENVIIGRNDRVVITDFGVACFRDERGNGPEDSPFVGTPLYMAPEQVEGRRSTDARADLYALGAMMYHMLTGEPPFTGRTLLAIASARLESPPPDPRSLCPDLSEAVARTVRRCLARRPEDRFASALEVAAALEALAAQSRSTTGAESYVLDSGSSLTPTLRPRGTPLPGTKTVALLPFANQGASDDDYVAAELTEDLIDMLCQIPSLRVRPYATVVSSSVAELELMRCGRELGVQVLVTGTVRREGDELSLAIRLIGVEDGFQLWAKRFRRQVVDLLEVSSEVAKAVAERLTVDLAAPRRTAPEAPRAMELYLQGRASLRHVWPSAVLRAVKLLGEAHALERENATILGTYARARTRLWFWTGCVDDAEQARLLAEQALALAPESADARLALAGVHFMNNEHAAALMLLKGALARAPSLAEARELLGRILLEVGRIEDGLLQLRAAVELDPRLQEAVELARGSALLGRWDEVSGLLGRESSDPEEIPTRAITAARLALWSPDPAALLALLPPTERVEDPGRTYVAVVRDLAAAGRRLAPEHRQALDEYLEAARDRPRFRILMHQLTAEIFAYGGDLAGALAQVKEATRAGLVDLGWLEACPLLEPLRREARLEPARQSVLRHLSGVWEVLGLEAPAVVE
jgi:serine/threonine protein kinase/tetratricopeptide (TPR) repeat protein